MSVHPPSFAMVDEAVTTLRKVNTYIATGMDKTIEVMQDVVESDKDPNSESVAELKRIMLECTAMERDLQQFLLSVEYVKKQSIEGADGDLEKILDKKLAKLQERNNSEDLKKHEKYLELLQKVDDLSSQDAGVGGGDASPAVGGSNTLVVDEDVLMTHEVQTKCPFTGREMTEPMRNKLCGHHYDLSGIRQLMKNRKGKAKCPVSNCINDKPIASCDLEENKQLKKLIEKKMRQAAKHPKKH